MKTNHDTDTDLIEMALQNWRSTHMGVMDHPAMKPVGTVPTEVLYSIFGGRKRPERALIALRNEFGALLAVYEITGSTVRRWIDRGPVAGPTG